MMDVHGMTIPHNVHPSEKIYLWTKNNWCLAPKNPRTLLHLPVIVPRDIPAHTCQIIDSTQFPK
jgi:hypothetical protein